MKEAPLRRDTLALAGVLLGELADEGALDVLRRQLAHRVLGLLEDVSLALAGFERTAHLRSADAGLQALRSLLALAYELDVLPEESYAGYLEQADLIGRQIGGLLRHPPRSAPPDGGETE